MSRRILLACYEVPGWGGASTRAYLLFERLQRDGWDVAYVNLVRRRHEAPLRALFGAALGNPRALPNVHTHVLDEPGRRERRALAALVRALGPTAMVGFGVIATNLLRAAAPGLPLVFMTAGSPRVEHLVEMGAVRDFMAFQTATDRGFHLPALGVDRERQALEASDRTIAHSPLVRFVLDRYFPEHRRRVHASTISLADLTYAAAEESAPLRRPFAGRDIDVLLVASSWRRPVKNYALAREVAARCGGLAVHVVGAVDDPCPNATHHGVLARRAELFALLGRARTLVSPSLVDAAPGVLFEASAMGCNVVASPNCGNWRLCHDELLARRCDAGELVDRIRRSLDRPYPDGRDRFRGGYGALVKALGELRAATR
jgi:glycosyltransferase involved in cell wall biosynthesis